MLKYNHIFNTDLDYPYHIHSIESDSTSLTINLNGSLVGYFRPTTGSTYSFTSYITTPDILSLMAVGSRQAYDKKKDASFFKESTVKYISCADGRFLVKNNANGLYSWSTTERTRFFFNPEYFSSNFLWTYTIGYVPTGVVVDDLWDETTAQELFLSKVYIHDSPWGGEQAIADVDPMTIDYFDNAVTGIEKTITVDYFLDELQDLVDGDIITINNGSETLDMTVKNCTTSATYAASTETTRPIVHVPIDVINPNKKVVYSKALAIGDTQTINITVEGNALQFDISRIAEV